MELLTTIAAQAFPFLDAIFDLGNEILGNDAAISPAKGAIFNFTGIINLVLGFMLNLFFVGIVVRFFYYPKCKRSEFFFTFILIAISIFLLIYLLGGVKLKTGFALGLFAIFSIIRYRTEQVAIREMTYLFIIILSPSGAYYESGLAPVGIWIEDDYVRAVKGGMGFAKTGGNYAASLIAQVKAHDAGYSQVLWLDGVERKYIEEVGAMNIFFKIDGKIVTPMLNGSILPGVTRDSVINLVKSWGVEVEERKISVEELLEVYPASCMLLDASLYKRSRDRILRECAVLGVEAVDISRNGALKIAPHDDNFEIIPLRGK